MHAAYEIQSILSSGFVVSYYIPQDRTDICTLVPAFEKFYKMYKKYQENNNCRCRIRMF